MKKMELDVDNIGTIRLEPLMNERTKSVKIKQWSGLNRQLIRPKIETEECI